MDNMAFTVIDIFIKKNHYFYNYAFITYSEGNNIFFYFY